MVPTTPPTEIVGVTPEPYPEPLPGRPPQAGRTAVMAPPLTDAMASAPMLPAAPAVPVGRLIAISGGLG